MPLLETPEVIGGPPIEKDEKMEKCNFLKILQCPDFANLWGDFWHLSHPKKLNGTDGGFNFLRIAFSSHVWDIQLIHIKGSERLARLSES